MTDEIKIEEPIKEQITEKVETKQEEIKKDPEIPIEELNWRKFRQEREAERKAKIEAEELARKKEEENLALQRALEAIVSKPTEPNYEVPEEDELEKKVEQIIRKKEEDWQQKQLEKEKRELPQRLQQSFPDFNQICTEENLDYLSYHYPEVAEGNKHYPESFAKWEGIYKALKRFIPNKQSGLDAKKAEANLTKPGAMSKPGVTQTGDQAPYMLDDARRAANWARMQKTIKGII